MDLIYTSKLASVKSGQVITINARPTQNAQSFVVNLSGTGENEVLLHLSVRFGETPVIVRNTRSGLWGVEERVENLIPGNSMNPIKPGVDFKLAIFIDDSYFYVSIDDKPYCTFMHRENPSNITTLSILDHIETVYQVQHATSQPKKWPALVESTFRLSIPRRFKIGDIFVITGVAHGSDKGSFALNVYDEEIKRPFFHMRADLNEKILKINSQCENHYWLKETRHKPLPYPFEIGHQFKIAIIIRENNFSISINGDIFGALEFKESAEKILSRMNGIEIASRAGTRIQVISFDLHEMEKDGPSFASHVADVLG